MPASDYTPTVDQVGALLRARTKTSNGTEAGTFNLETRPTDAEANLIITQAANTMAMIVGDDVPIAIAPDVLQFVALRAAMMIELSYYPEQVASDRSAYAEYKELWDEAIGDDPDSPGWLVLAVRRAQDTGVITIDQPNRPRYHFPPSRPLTW